MCEKVHSMGKALNTGRERLIRTRLIEVPLNSKFL